MPAKHATPFQQLLASRDFQADVYSMEPMSKHTTYRIGGPARYYIQVETISSLSHLVSACRENDVKWMVVGKGSNLLVADEGFDGVIITLGSGFKNYDVIADKGSIVSGAGVLFSVIVQEAFKSSLAGLEFAVGTPGAIGGALKMNAGSAIEGIGSCVKSVTVLSAERGLRKLLQEDIEWGYRKTSFAPDDVIVECELSLKPVDPFFIQGKMEANLARRKKTQPLDLPSCGSVFKNPEGMHVAKMIDDMGFKGKRVGGAQVSEKHANFIVNTGDAKARDVVELISQIRHAAKEEYGVDLQTEVKFVGFDE